MVLTKYILLNESEGPNLSICFSDIPTATKCNIRY